MKINPEIFKAYDVRGIYPEQLNEQTAYAFGRAYATHYKDSIIGKTVAVGGDMRISTPSLKEQLIAGLLDSGVNVDDLGMVSTPTFYFASAFYGYAGGIQVSASHNPKQWNGFKVVTANAFPVGGKTGLQDIKKIIEDESYILTVKDRAEIVRGKLQTKENILDAEADDQVGFTAVEFSSIKPFKIVIDAANGMGSLDMAALFKKLPCEIIPMNFDPDGTFPAHEADPIKPENNKDLCERVIAEKADLGIAIDGDADRYFFIDEKGQMVPQQILRGLMAEIELQKTPGAVVAYDIRPGKITTDLIEQNGGKALVTPSGHSLIKDIMIKNNAVFGGESSGHYFYKLPYGTFEAPMVLVTKLLDYLSKTAKPFSEILEPLKIYSHSGEINMKVASREQAEMIIQLVKSNFKDGNIQGVDGISIEYPDFWFNLRASNTEPLIRFTLEAKSKKIMETKRDEILKFLEQFKA